MPQSKGNENWLTNPRKTVNEKNVRLDNSETYLKNEDLEQELQVALDAIHIEQRRVMEEREGDIKAVKQSVKTMSAMQRFVKLNSAKLAFEASLQDRKKVYDDIVALQKSDIKKEEMDKKSKFQKSNASGFSNVTLNDSDDELDFHKSNRVKFRRTRTKSAHPKLHSYNTTNNGEDNDFARPVIVGRPKSSFVSVSSRPSTTTRRSRSPGRRYLHRRPKTTMSIRSSIAREFNSAGPTPRFQAKLAGRSFHELKGLTGFDAMKSTQHNARRAEVLIKRAQELEQDDVRLQNRILSFYADLDNFTRRTLESPGDS